MNMVLCLGCHNLFLTINLILYNKEYKNPDHEIITENTVPHGSKGYKILMLMKLMLKNPIRIKS